jgi:hypothetical protein
MADVDEDPVGEKTEAKKPRVRASRAKNTPPNLSRLERRAAKVKETIVEAVAWAGLDFGGDDLSFVETLKRDADRVGHGIAALAENFKPFGIVIDKVFGATGPLAIFVALAPSIRAGRRDLVAKLGQRKQRQADQAEAELRPEPEESRGRDETALLWDEVAAGQQEPSADLWEQAQQSEAV